MIPKYLKIKGLYSYQKEQEIRFDALTDASLFGIFGSVGSGKSSILEAITFALYGDTERLNRSGDDRTYNMMNLRSDELLIDFECIAGKKGDRYRFTVRGRRNSRNFKDVKTFERKGYVMEQETWIPLDESTTAESIIGLSYDNFRRTIIIPQGRFQEFIELKDAERTRMMKELFQLEKYDLSRNVATLARANDLKWSGVEGQLLGLGEVNAEMIAAEEQKREVVRKQIAEIQARLIVVTEQEAIYQKRKADFEKQQHLEAERVRLEAMLPGIQKREQALSRFEICSIHFKSFADQKRHLLAGQQRDQPVFEKNKIRASEVSQLIANQKESLASIQVHYEVRDNLLVRARELEKLLSVREQIQQAQKYRDQVEKGEEKLRLKEVLIESLKKTKAELEAENEIKKAKQADAGELGLVKSWFASLDEIQKNKDIIRKEAEALQAEVSADRAALSVRIEKANKDFSWELGSTVELPAIQTQIQGFYEKNETEIIGKQKEGLLINTKLEVQRFADNLSEGEPCPLCGSVHHPVVLHGDDRLGDQLAKNKSDLKQLSALGISVRQFESDTEKTFAKLEALEKQKGNIKARYKQINDRLEEHRRAFVWNRFDKDDRAGFDLFFDEASAIQKSIRENEQEIKRQSEQIELQMTEKTEKIEQPLQRLRNEVLKTPSQPGLASLKRLHPTILLIKAMKCFPAWRQVSKWNTINWLVRLKKP
jgi:DNA repair protein SbcC/Rad50